MSTSRYLKKAANTLLEKNGFKNTGKTSSQTENSYSTEAKQLEFPGITKNGSKKITQKNGRIMLRKSNLESLKKLKV